LENNYADSVGGHAGTRCTKIVSPDISVLRPLVKLFGNLSFHIDGLFYVGQF